MPVYKDSETLDKVMRELFDRTVADTEGLKELSRSNMIFLLDISDPAAVITVNGKGQPPNWSYGRPSGKIDLGIRTEMDILHQVLLKEMRLRDAFFGHKMKVDGSIFAAMRLEALFHVLQAVYPVVLKDLKIETTGTADQA